MERLKVPKLENISFYKHYGNKYCGFWRNSITREDYLTAYVCGEKKTFESTEKGLQEMEDWINEQRLIIGKKLGLIDKEDAQCTTQQKIGEKLEN